MSKVHTLEKDKTIEKIQEIRVELDRSDLRKLTEQELEEKVLGSERKLSLDCKGDKNLPLTVGFLRLFHENELDSEGYPYRLDKELIEKVQIRKNILSTSFSEMYFRASELGILEKATTDISGYEMRFDRRIKRLIEFVENIYEQVFMYARVRDLMEDPSRVALDDKQVGRKSVMVTVDEDNSPYQQLLLFLLQQAWLNSYKRYGDYCCKQITTPEGHETRAWRQMLEIKDFVYLSTQKETQYDMWQNLTSKGSIVNDTVRHLTNCKDIQFPEIKKNRNVWSFRNGIFVSKEWNGSRYISKFYEYGAPDTLTLDPTIVSSKYFDQPFDDFSEVTDWYDIPTPNMQRVMDYQKFPEDVCRWLYVFCGRLCFAVNEMDRWQVIPFLKGVAQSGKSTIITKVCKHFYDTQDVKVLSNNIEKKFGLESILGGFVFISPEVKGDLQLEQAEFQSLVSGEDLSIARKFKAAQSLTWVVPGMLGGNEVPNWKDNSGSILRRIVTWNFGRQVVPEDADPLLDNKLLDELPAIMCKCVRAYLDYAQKYHDKDIWTVLPKYFKDIQAQVAMVTNQLQHFLASEKIRYGKDLFVPQKVFVDIFNKHCTNNNLPKCRFNQDLYTTPFNSRELDVRTHTGTYNNRSYAAQPFIFGCDVVQSENIELDDNY
jgi:hypothetical protein